jgi:hypothetical protein
MTRRATVAQLKCDDCFMRQRTTYQKVFDDRKRRVRRLGKPNGWFYGRLHAADEVTSHKSHGHFWWKTRFIIIALGRPLNNLLKGKSLVNEARYFLISAMFQHLTAQRF